MAKVESTETVTISQVAERLAYIRGLLRTKEGKKLITKAIARNWRKP